MPSPLSGSRCSRWGSERCVRGRGRKGVLVPPFFPVLILRFSHLFGLGFGYARFFTKSFYWAEDGVR